MATHYPSILGDGLSPDTSGDVFQEDYSIHDSGAVLDPKVWVFQDSGNKDGLRGKFTLANNYVGSAVLEIIWTANATTGNVIWDWSVLTRSGTEDMGAAATRTTETVTTAKSGTAFARTSSRITLTDGDYAAGDQVLYELFRDGASEGGGGMAASALVFDVLFEYSDT